MSRSEGLGWPSRWRLWRANRTCRARSEWHRQCLWTTKSYDQEWLLSNVHPWRSSGSPLCSPSECDGNPWNDDYGYENESCSDFVGFLTSLAIRYSCSKRFGYEESCPTWVSFFVLYIRTILWFAMSRAVASLWTSWARVSCSDVEGR